jgi:TolB-like protein/Tfp pilus assembly protein PilF
MCKSFYEFGGFRLDVSEHLLYRPDGKVASLKPKVVETLELLVRERGRLLTKDELMARLWPDTIVGEANLSQNIYQLRKVLETDEAGPRFIETVPRRGYRFVADVSEVPDSELERETLETRESESTQPTSFNSIAVLPLTNESADPHAEYLSDGITESIINHLAQLPQLKVIARSTVFRYKGRQVAPQKVGRELGVKVVLTGRVLELNDRIIVRTELVDAIDGWQLWGEQYDRFSSDLLELQEVIAQDVSGKLQLRLTGDERKKLSKRHTTSTEAYHLFIKARYYLNKRLTSAIHKAVEYFQQAIDIDPTYAAAYVGLADCYPLLTLYGALLPRDAYTKAEAAARKALEIDDSMAEAHNALGVVKLFYRWDWSGADQTFKHAIRLNPGYADVHQRYGLLLVARRQFAEAEVEFEKALTLDPLSMITRTFSGYPYYYNRDFQRAVGRFQEVIEMDKSYSMAHFRLGLTYAQLERYDDAIQELQSSANISGDRDVIAAIGYVHARFGNIGEAKRALTELDQHEESSFVSAYDRAIIYAGMNEVEVALDWLENALVERSYWLIYVHSDPALDPLRGSPRFARLVSQIASNREAQLASR